MFYRGKHMRAFDGYSLHGGLHFLGDANYLVAWCGSLHSILGGKFCMGYGADSKVGWRQR